MEADVKGKLENRCFGNARIFALSYSMANAVSTSDIKDTGKWAQVTTVPF